MMAAQAAYRSDRLAKTASVQDRGVDIAAGHRIANTKQAEPIFMLRGRLLLVSGDQGADIGNPLIIRMRNKIMINLVIGQSAMFNHHMIG